MLQFHCMNYIDLILANNSYALNLYLNLGVDNFFI